MLLFIVCVIIDSMYSKKKYGHKINIIFSNLITTKKKANCIFLSVEVMKQKSYKHEVVHIIPNKKQRKPRKSRATIIISFNGILERKKKQRKKERKGSKRRNWNTKHQFQFFFLLLILYLQLFAVSNLLFLFSCTFYRWNSLTFDRMSLNSILFISKSSVFD